MEEMSLSVQRLLGRFERRCVVNGGKMDDESSRSDLAPKESK
jgi:hypothetical protein